MTGLRSGYAGPEHVRGDAARARRATSAPAGDQAGARRSRSAPTTNTGMVALHQSIAELLASRGQWRQAYYHLNAAFELMSAETTPRIPEQLRHEVDRLRKEHAEAQEQSRRDSLTTSYNRRYLDERLADLLCDESCARAGLAVGLVDLDWFKQINDSYGHPLGDRVLQHVVELLQEVLAPGAFCARYGGEEFVLVLPATGAETAVAACEAARGHVERFPWGQMAPGLRVTVSVGIAHQFGLPDAGSSPTRAEQQLLSADALLYAAKRSGRNAVAYRAGHEVRLAGPAADRRGVAGRGY